MMWGSDAKTFVSKNFVFRRKRRLRTLTLFGESTGIEAKEFVRSIASEMVRQKGVIEHTLRM